MNLCELTKINFFVAFMGFWIFAVTQCSLFLGFPKIPGFCLKNTLAYAMNLCELTKINFFVAFMGFWIFA